MSDSTPVQTPKQMGNRGKLFEQAILDSFEKSDHGLYRNGVKTFMGKDKQLHKSKSFPDFSGVKSPAGRHIEIEAKECSAASMSYAARTIDNSSQNQLYHLMAKAEKGGISYYFIHFCERVLKTRIDPALTVALPVHPNIYMWQQIVNQDKLTITRQDCLSYGQKIAWYLPYRAVSRVLMDVSIIEEYDSLVEKHSRVKGFDWINTPFFC